MLLFLHNSKSDYVRANGFGGVIIWEIGVDDVLKECCTTDYPLLRSINYGLYKNGSHPSEYGCRNSESGDTTAPPIITTPTISTPTTDGTSLNSISNYCFLILLLLILIIVN